MPVSSIRWRSVRNIRLLTRGTSNVSCLFNGLMNQSITHKHERNIMVSADGVMRGVGIDGDVDVAQPSMRYIGAAEPLAA
jgi:hypothetical protein